MVELMALVAQARALANDHPCETSGHRWGHNGGRPCPHHPSCSQPVFQCERCGDFDYGRVGGPGHEHCLRECEWRDVPVIEE